MHTNFSPKTSGEDINDWTQLAQDAILCRNSVNMVINFMFGWPFISNYIRIINQLVHNFFYFFAICLCMFRAIFIPSLGG
jgi:hypothetical protein